MKYDVRGEASGVRGQIQIETMPGASIVSRITFHE